MFSIGQVFVIVVAAAWAFGGLPHSRRHLAAAAYLHPRSPASRALCAGPNELPRVARVAGRLTGQATGFLYRTRARFFQFAEDTEMTKVGWRVGWLEGCLLWPTVDCASTRLCARYKPQVAPAKAQSGNSLPRLQSQHRSGPPLVSLLTDLQSVMTPPHLHLHLPSQFSRPTPPNAVCSCTKKCRPPCISCTPFEASCREA